MIRNLSYVFILFLCISCGETTTTSPNSTSNSTDSLKLEGTISYWEIGTTGSIDVLGKRIAVSEQGMFSGTTIISSETKAALLPSTDFGSVKNCLTSSTLNSRVGTLPDPEIFQGDKRYGDLFLQSENFDGSVGDVYQEYTYYTEATTISGRCVEALANGFTLISVFNNVKVKKGWNDFVITIIEQTDDSNTARFELNNGTIPLRWEIEPIPVNELNSSNGVIAVDYEFTEFGIRLLDVLEGGVADLSGLKKGDVVTAVDGESIVGMNLGAVIVRVEGEVGTSVKLTVIRGDETLEFDVIRKAIG